MQTDLQDFYTRLLDTESLTDTQLEAAQGGRLPIACEPPYPRAPLYSVSISSGASASES